MDNNAYQQFLENKSHTEDSFPYNTYLCTIPLDFSRVLPHWHNEAEFIVIKKGAGMVHVDLVEYTVHAGDIVVVLPRRLHSIEELPGCTMEYENILFRSELLLSKSNDLCTSAFLHPLLRGNLPTDCYIHPGRSYYRDFQSSITAIDTLCEKKPTGYQLAIKGHLFQIFYLLITNQNKKALPQAELKKIEKLKLVVRYIEEHYSEPITVAQMATLCCYSESHFMKFFRQQMKESFIHYLNNYRLTMASHLLTTTSLTVLEIADKVGFENLSYFNRSFKKRYGVTPRQLR